MKDLNAKIDWLTEDLEALLGTHRDGYAMARGFYTSAEVYQEDIKSYWNQTWIWVGHTCQLPQKGNFFLFDYGPESIIIARDRRGEVGAFVNVCRHRGARVCTERAGRAHAFSCPYHAWVYELNGDLRAAREMDAGFDRASHGLLKAHVRILDGLIFISTAENPPEIDEAIAELKPLVAPFRLDRLKIAHEASYPVPANWKLAIENYMECYHCGPAHLDYSQSHSLKDPHSITPELLASLRKTSVDAGLPAEANFSWSKVGHETADMDAYCGRYPLYPGYHTGSKNGALVAPLLGDLKTPFNGANDMQLGILNNFLIYSDHVVGYRFVPRSVQETDIQMVWYVREDAVEGEDYDLEDLTWLWHVTTLDDERIIRVNQEGVNSFHFRPGPLSQMEEFMTAFYDGYLNTLKRARGVA
ncbi:MAG: aromatic ring-hydroxylating dioxygenase subunit alpha [Pseudomonadota bacterium]